MLDFRVSSIMSKNESKIKRKMVIYGQAEYFQEAFSALKDVGIVMPDGCQC